MDKDKVARLLSSKFGTEDNRVGKELLLANEPEIRKYLIRQETRCIIPKERIKEMGYHVVRKDFLQFDYEDYPELKEDKDE